MAVRIALHVSTKLTAIQFESYKGLVMLLQHGHEHFCTYVCSLL